jgi:hypothetical protein
MITAAITAAIGAIMAFFGVPPGPYLAVVAIAVKLIIVGLALLFGVKALTKKKAEAQAAAAGTPPAPGSEVAAPDKPGAAS